MAVRVGGRGGVIKEGSSMWNATCINHGSEGGGKGGGG